eukprot:CAMPEP_0201513084 /NCGR_PEP_ID=MMETSP0161_2-20130828/5207_1 /ASSEMBLY_ACC=CAM_ASM_000251 /TAXON_ID=180227 /ORGANISM="Neoparamoeba aestuarina, Strain SoJaBio B1-5/56/2" /LENGTH=34 /DNA_ID= /DNA_START= /DNA_END= /DNA_ORIENTATION=
MVLDGEKLEVEVEYVQTPRRDTGEDIPPERVWPT